ncbi:MAG: ABC transporter ATP-binding protein [Thermodesulfobacteriota bacterium]
MATLEVTQLTKLFGSLLAVDRLNFSLRTGEVLGMIGPNGAGKTTVFNIIAGVDRPTSGQVRFEGTLVSGMKPHRICRLGVAKTSQTAEPFLGLSVIENVLVAALHGGRLRMRQARDRAEEILLFLGLERYRHQRAAVLSVAQRRRLDLARTLATGARVILLDENMAGLNPHEIDETLDLLRKIRETGKSMIVVEHLMRAVMGISDRVIVLDHGTKIAEGTPKEVVDNEQVIRAYLGTKTTGF